MVYCTECETKNEATETCVNCGAKLEVLRGKNLEKRIEDAAEEFGK